MHVPHLKTAANAARLLADALREDGFAVTVANDLDHDSLLATVKHFAKDAAAADWAVIYFDGHSMSAEDGSSYLIPVDAEIADDRQLAAKAVAEEELISAVAGVHTLSVVIIDACRRNPFTARLRPVAGEPPIRTIPGLKCRCDSSPVHHSALHA